MSKFELQFLGAAGTVTGSKYLLTYNSKNILVDCGLFQGLKNLRLKNWEAFPVKASEIDFVILTHAHIDHSGYIPRLINDGFKGKIYCTQATKDVCKILLPDCGYLLEEEAAYLNKSGKTKHKPALPLFTAKEAEAALDYLEEISFKTKKVITPDLSFEFQYAGHILGAASVIINIADKKIAFTGDVGRLEDQIFFPPENLPVIDYLVTESTYGNRLHATSNPIDDLEKIINSAYAKQGVIIIPAFAVGRAQTLMFYLSVLKNEKRIPDLPIYLNSPMATDFTAVFLAYKELHKLSEQQCSDLNNVVRYVRTAQDSKALNEMKGPMLIISASGMITGGRVLHHIKTFASYAQNTIVLAGFQSAGTRGEALQNGAKEIKIHGEYVQVNAKVEILDNMSAHADYRELIKWFKQSKVNPRKVFITHGEVSAADEFRRRLADTFGWDCTVPVANQKVILN